MGIRFSITVCSEYEEIIKLIPFIHQNLGENDEILILYDQENGNYKVEEYLHNLPQTYPKLGIWYDHFNGNFADWKNKLHVGCDKDFLIQLDADEIPNPWLLKNLTSIIEKYPEVDLFRIPRINTLEGDQDEIKKYVASQNWTINEKGWINWPGDYQGRVYRNSSEIKWRGKVHEHIIGAKKFINLPPQEEFCLYHPKTLDRQKSQNKFYQELN